MFPSQFSAIFVSLLLTNVVVKAWLAWRQLYHVASHRAEVPPAFREQIGIAAHHKAADYTRTLVRFGLLGVLFDAALLLVFTIGGGIVLLVGLAAAAMVIYKVVEVQKWGNPLWVALAWLFVWPRMWAVRVVGSPETLFVLWIIASLYFFQKRKFWQAAIFGSLAVSTKSPGILLFPAYILWWGENFMKTKKWEGKIYPILLIPAALAAVFGLFWLRTGDFWAYFHSGDNIHLQLLPFKVFDSSQSWVGNFWLEDVLWIYFIGALGIYHAFKKSRVWGWWGAVFFVSILFVSHRDISRYSLPLVPIVLVGLSELLNRKEVRLTLLLFLIPAYLYTVNFVSHNFFPISDWGPFL